MNPPTMVYRGRFALLWHEIPEVQGDSQSASSESSVGSHWDLLLELDNGELLTWQIASLPDLKSLAQSLEITAKRLKNHRAVYLDYEGPISGNRGSVRQLAFGVYAASIGTHLAEGLVSRDSRMSSGRVKIPRPTSTPEILVVELTSPEWRLELKSNLVEEEHCTLMTLTKLS